MLGNTLQDSHECSPDFNRTGKLCEKLDSTPTPLKLGNKMAKEKKKSNQM